MNRMIERVAEAIADAEGLPMGYQVRGMARAAIVEVATIRLELEEFGLQQANEVDFWNDIIRRVVQETPEKAAP